MSWRDNLLPASFRGAPFQYLDTRRNGGRRATVDEFPGRDSASSEDLGKRAKAHRIQGFVLGDDYARARDALEAALDGEGTGTLVHPYKGNLTVVCLTYSVREDIGRGRMAAFEMEFVEIGAQPSPVSATNTAAAASNAGASQQTVLSSDFGALYRLEGLPGFIRAALTGNVVALVNDLTSLAGQPGLSVGALADALAAIGGASEQPVALGQAIADFFTGYAAAVGDILPVNDPTLSSRGQPPVSDPSFGLAAFADWGSSLPPIIGTTPQRLQQAANQAALISLVQGSAVAAMAQLYANTAFVSAADATAAWDQMNDLVDARATEAADQGDDTAYAGWMTLFSTVSVDLTQRALQLPQILDFQFGTSLPALALAQRIYQDGSRAPELIARNAAPHPLFMPRKIEALAD